jgi:thioredoxin reductase (NADPH)
VVGGGGEEWLERLELRGPDGATETVPADALFLMIGADPNTDWLPPEVLREEGGFLATGEAARRNGDWPLDRAPFALETSLPGVFAAGDVRAGSMSRVAAAVGEGGITVRMVHELFAAERLTPLHR